MVEFSRILQVLYLRDVVFLVKLSGGIMIRVLQVYPQMNNAGTERVIMNLYENIDLEKVQFDFLVEKQGELDEKIRNMGGRVYYLPSDGNYGKKLKQFFKEHPEYRVIHTHTHGNMGTVLKIAKKCGVECRIAHSHNARNDLPKIAAFIKRISSINIERNANYFFACSENAAKWLFPYKAKQCRILYNGIQLKDYLFDKRARESVRDRMQIDEQEFVMIHVGRFARQKNHEYLVKILETYNRQFPDNWKILLVGVGPLQDEIKRQVVDKKLDNHVVFLDNRTDVNKLLSAADMFVFPSLHEGLGIVVIEAQASGIPCIVSDAVPVEADMEIGLLHTMSLRDAPEKWVDVINENKMNAQNRESYRDDILRGKYNIETIAAQMQQFYMEGGR